MSLNIRRFVGVDDINLSDFDMYHLYKFDTYDSESQHLNVVESMYIDALDEVGGETSHTYVVGIPSDGSDPVYVSFDIFDKNTDEMEMFDSYDDGDAHDE